MANIKISQLPTLGAGNINCIFPVVANGTTYQMNFTDLIDTISPGGIQSASEITQSLYVDGTSVYKFPSANAVKTYADALVTGLLSDRGNYTPGVVSPGAYPTTGGRGVGGLPVKGDLWFIAANGFLGTTAVLKGQSVRALVNTPGQTPTNWDILDVGWTVAPEDSANKVLTKADFITNGASNVKYPSVVAVKQYIDQNVTLQGVITNGRSLTNNNNLQGANSGTAMGAVSDVNAFGNGAASSNNGSDLNAIGRSSGNSNNGTAVNAIGVSAGNNNSGSNANLIGLTAGESNSGSYVNGFGWQAAKLNNKDYVNAIGYTAGYGNTGTNLNAVGRNAGKNNTGADSNFMGYSAGESNIGTYVVGIGSDALKSNQGGNSVGVGAQAGQLNTGSFLTAVGSNTANNQSGNYVNAIGYGAGANNTYSYVNLLGPGASADGPSQLVFVNSTAKKLRFDGHSVTGDRKYTLPNASGTMVLSVNGVTPSPTGDITLPSSAQLPYLMYAAYLQFSPGGITATQLYNTIGNGSGDGINDIAWSYGLGGWYEATMSSGPFTTKSAVVPSGYLGNGQYFAITGSRISASQMRLQGIRPSDNALNATAYVPNVYVEIRIYP